MLHVVLMVGGAGTRFWPMGRATAPKYLLRIVGKKSMLEQTVERVAPLAPPERVLCITSREQAGAIRRALPQVPAGNVVAEPVGRDSAACVALAAVIVRRRDPDGVMLCMPGDNLVRQAGTFRRAVRAAVRAAREGRLVTFGVPPTAAETRFGYIHRGAPIVAARRPRVFRVRRFVEKPDLATAERMVRSGEYYWNSGNFVWRADVILEEMRRHAPELYAAAERIGAALGTRRAGAVIRREYLRLSKISIDYAVMEKAREVAVVEAEFDWDDVGSWTALERHYPCDADGNTVVGSGTMLDSTGCIVSADRGHLVAAIGMKNVIVVHTRDATLICPKERANDVKTLVQLLEKMGLSEYL